MSNADTVHDIYAAFGRGDIPAILAKVADDVEWEYDNGPTEVSWLQTRHGRDGVAEFFVSLGAMQIHRFVPKAVLQGDGLVVGVIDIDFTVIATGKRVHEFDEVHVWRFNEAGQVKRFRHRADTLKQTLAFRG